MKLAKKEDITNLRIEVLDIANDLLSNRIVVTPEERENYLIRFAALCYDPHSPFNIKGPLFFAKLLFLSVEFRISEDSDQCMSAQMIDLELRKLRKEFYKD